jgi:fructose-specific component phosphotransferase system IIB-like protein
MSRILFARCVAYAYRLELAVCLLLVAGIASAGEATLRWDPPTQNVDGSPLTDLAGYRVHYGPSPNELHQAIDIPNAGMNAYVVSDLAPGVYYFAMRAVNAEDEASDLSNIVTKTITAAATKAAYVIKQTRDNLALVVVGEVPADTSCASDKGVLVDGKAYYVVPRDAVTWAASVRSELVVAQCD